MWVMSSDGKHLIKAEHFSVIKNIGGKSSGKWAIVAYGSSRFADNNAVCGTYPDKDAAMNKLKKVFDEISKNGSDGTYQF